MGEGLLTGVGEGVGAATDEDAVTVVSVLVWMSTGVGDGVVTAVGDGVVPGG